MGSYLSSSQQQEKEMLEAIGLKSVDELYAMVPESAKLSDLALDSGKSELEVFQIIQSIGEKNHVYSSIFRGAGAYYHYIPSLVDSVTSKEEFLTAYTPYQAEISQGVLQSIFEYQSQICELTGMDVSNASVYDGAVAAAEGVLMTVERNRQEILVADTIHPNTLSVILTYCESREIPVTVLKTTDGKLNEETLKAALNDQVAGLYLQSPNYFGIIEDVESLTSAAHEAGVKVVLGANPMSYALLKTPGEMGVDIAVGEAQPLGIPLSFGGPYIGYMAAKKELQRKLPGRIVGQTVDQDGRRCFVLTLQAREQHIRREKASSNICSNEALCAMRVSVYLAAMGPSGLRDAAENSVSNAHYLAEKLDELGFKRVYDHEFFNEFLTESPISTDVLEEKLAEKKILSGLPIGDKVLWCATEMTDQSAIDELIESIQEVLR